VAVRLLNRIEASLKRMKIENYEVYMQIPEVTQLYMRRGERELINQVRQVGYSVRILEKGLGMACSNQTGDFGIKRCITQARKMARQSKEEKLVFPAQKPTSKVDIKDRRMWNEPESAVDEFQEKLVDAAAKIGVELPFAKIRAFKIRSMIMNSEGLDREKEETLFFTEVCYKSSGGGKLSEFWTTRYARRFEDVSLTSIEEWAELSKASLNAKPPKTERLEVIFSPQVACDLFVPVMNGQCTGLSLKQAISRFEEGETVAEETLSIIDDGLHPFGIQSSPFDDEGNPQSRTVLIDRGVFKNRVYDQYYGLEYGKDSTGNGLRQGMVSFLVDEKFKAVPRNQTSNLEIEPGKKSLEELISETERGLLVYKFSWANPDEATGIFASEIRNASLIAKGELMYPVKGGLIAGDIFTLMKNVTGISNQPEIVSGETAFSCITPWLRFKDVQVAGE